MLEVELGELPEEEDLPRYGISLPLIIITTKVVAVLEVQEEECRVHIRILIIGLFVFSLLLSQPF